MAGFKLEKLPKTQRSITLAKAATDPIADEAKL